MAEAYNYSSVASQAALGAPIDGNATTIQVVDASGWPAVAPFTAVIDPDTEVEEIVTVTQVASTTWTVLRGQDGSPALPHADRAVVRHMIVGRDLRLSRQHENATAGIHGRTTALVATEDAQTLKNKTISGADNTITNLNAGNLTTGTLPEARLPSTVVKTTGSQTLTGKTMSGASNTFSNIPQSAVTDLTSDISSLESDVSDLQDDVLTGKLLARTAITSNVECAGSTELVVATTFAAVSGRRYRVVFQGSFFRQSSSSIRATTTVRYKSGSSISASPDGTLIMQRLADATVDNLLVPLHLEDTFAPGVTGTVAVGVSGSRTSGSGIIEYSAGGSNTCYVAVYDAGPA